MAPNSELRCGMQCAGLSHMGVCECVYMQWTDEGFAQAWSKLMAQNANKIALHTPIPKSYLRSDHVDAKKKEKQGQGLWILDKRKRKITTALSLCLGKGKKKIPSTISEPGHITWGWCEEFPWRRDWCLMVSYHFLQHCLRFSHLAALFKLGLFWG